MAGAVIHSSVSVTRVPASPLLTNLAVLVPEGRTNAAEARRAWNVTEEACLGGVGGVLEGTWCGKTKMEQGELERKIGAELECEEQEEMLC